MTEQFLYKIQPTRAEMLTEGPTPEESDILAAHFAYLEALATAGTVILAGRTLNTDASSFGIVIYQAESEDEARKIMLYDPAVDKQVMHAQMYPYRIALLTPPRAAD